MNNIKRYIYILVFFSIFLTLSACSENVETNKEITSEESTGYKLVQDENDKYIIKLRMEQIINKYQGINDAIVSEYSLKPEKATSSNEPNTYRVRGVVVINNQENEFAIKVTFDDVSLSSPGEIRVYRVESSLVNTQTIEDRRIEAFYK